MWHANGPVHLLLIDPHWTTGWAGLEEKLPICLYCTSFLPTTGPCDFILVQANLCHEPNWPTCHFYQKP